MMLLMQEGGVVPVLLGLVESLELVGWNWLDVESKEGGAEGEGVCLSFGCLSC